MPIVRPPRDAEEQAITGDLVCAIGDPRDLDVRFAANLHLREAGEQVGERLGNGCHGRPAGF